MDKLKAKQEIKDRLFEFEQAKEGWDGYDADIINKNLLDIVQELVFHLIDDCIRQPELGIVEDGSVDIVWAKEGLYCTIDEEELTITKYQLPIYRTTEHGFKEYSC